MKDTNMSTHTEYVLQHIQQLELRFDKYVSRARLTGTKRTVIPLKDLEEMQNSIEAIKNRMLTYEENRINNKETNKDE